QCSRRLGAAEWGGKMRITTTKRPSTERTPLARRASGQGGAESFEIPSAMPAGPAPGASRKPPVAQIDAIVALQSVGPEAEARSQAVAQGSAVLDLLDDLKVQLLAGNITKSQIGRLAVTVQSRPDYSDDLRLQDLLDHIDLRARVELAKLGRSLP
ncbi:MAG: flagellar assembly protein FliX, partial [Methyloligellaceae bacterium]